MSNNYITKSTRKVLSRRAASKVTGEKYPSNYEVGRAGKAIDQLINADPDRFIEFHEKFMRPKQDEIVDAVVSHLTPQATLFDVSEMFSEKPNEKIGEKEVGGGS